MSASDEGVGAVQMLRKGFDTIWRHRDDVGLHQAIYQTDVETQSKKLFSRTSQPPSQPETPNEVQNPRRSVVLNHGWNLPSDTWRTPPNLWIHRRLLCRL